MVGSSTSYSRRLLGYVNRKLGIVPEQFTVESEYTSLPPQNQGAPHGMPYMNIWN